jgi:hypothetical protein
MKVELFKTIDLTGAAGAKFFADSVSKGFLFRPAEAKAARVVGTVRGGGTVRRGKRKKKRGIYRIDEDMGRRILRMKDEGVALKEIARIHRLSASGIRNYCSRVRAAAK